MFDDPEVDEVRESLAFLQRNKDVIDKHIHEAAGLYGIAFRALKAEGFTDYQAIELILSHGPTLGGSLHGW